MRKSLSLLTIFAVLLAGNLTFGGKGNSNGGGGGGGGGGEEPPAPALGYRYEISYATAWGADHYLPSGVNDFGDVVTTPNWIFDGNGNLIGPVDPVVYSFSDNTEYSINEMIQGDFAAGLLDVDPDVIDTGTGQPFEMVLATKINNRGQIAVHHYINGISALGCLYTPATVDAEGIPVAGSLRNVIPAELLDPEAINQTIIYDLNNDGDIVCRVSGINGGSFVYLSEGGPVGGPVLLDWDDMSAFAPAADQFISDVLNDRYVDANGDSIVQFAGYFVTGTEDDIRYDFNLTTGTGTIDGTGFANSGAENRYMKGMNNLGNIVGREYDVDSRPTSFNAYVYIDGAAQSFDPTQGQEGRAADINDQGVVVGGVDVSYKRPRATKREPFVFIDGTMYMIRDLIDGESAFNVIYPSHLNNQGQILARAYDYDGVQYILLLTPYIP